MCLLAVDFGYFLLYTYTIGKVTPFTNQYIKVELPQGGRFRPTINFNPDNTERTEYTQSIGIEVMLTY